MDTTKARIQRSQSRASTAPFVAPDGHVVKRRVLDRDIELLSLFARRRYLSALYAAALLRRSEQGISRRLRALKEDGVDLLKLCDLQENDRGARIVGYLYYELTKNGMVELAEEGITAPARSPDKQFPHTLMIDQIMTSFDIGLMDRSDIVMRAFADLLPSMPEATRNAPHSHQIFIGKRDGKPHSLIPDDRPFALERTVDGKRRNFPGIEADTASMPQNPADFARSAICNKFADYLYCLENDLFRNRYGFKTTFVPFITRTKVRMENMKSHLAAMTEGKPSLRQWFLFKTHPTIKSREKPRATGHMLTEPWSRVGYPDLQLDQ
jgi:hypothetical protein